MTSLTTSQIDRLGERLRQGISSEEDLRLLDAYRRTFRSAYETVVTTLRQKLAFETTGRPAKTITSIVAKLRREHVRLSQIQDIAGCRLVVPDRPAQAAAIERLLKAFPQARLVDRTQKPSHGYRAVHVIVHLDGKPVEIQVRTDLQHLWAQISERLSDLYDPRLKYGCGPAKAVEFLQESSALVRDLEDLEKPLGVTIFYLAAEQIEAIERLARQRDELKRRMLDHFQRVLADLDRPGRSG